MKTVIFSIAITIAFIMTAGSAFSQEQVKVEQGIVQGTIANGLRIYKGLPFAAPPVGDLRWKAPQPAPRWEGVKLTTEYAQKAGAPSISEMRKIEAGKLPLGMGMGGAWPIVDGYVIPDDQYLLYEAGKYNDVPILMGYNSDEGASFSREKTPEEYIAGVKTRYGKFADALIEAYPPGEKAVGKTARDLARDAAFGWQTWIWARLQSKTGKSKVFYYYFDQHPDFPEDSPRYGFGSPHGQDVAYVFMHLDRANPQTTKSDIEISEAMGTYWTNFAKYGDPNGQGVPKWPAFSDANPEVMVLGPTPHVGPVPSAESLKVLDEYFRWRRTHEGKEWAK